MAEMREIVKNPMTKVRFYIDGFNLYHAIEALNDPRLKWLNIMKLCKQHLRKDEELDEVYFFTAIWPYDQEKQRRHRNFLAALKATGVKPIEGNFKRSDRKCFKQNRSCPFREEKQTDVNIAIQMVNDALAGNAQRLVLVTADSDQVPTAKLIAGIEGVRLSLIFPPGRASEARDLGNQISDRKELTAGQLLTCQLPRTVNDATGKAVAHMPAAYIAG